MRGEQDGMPSALVSEAGADEDDGDKIERFRQTCLDQKSVYARMAIVVAGPLANFLLAILIFWMIFLALGQSVARLQINAVLDDSAAEAAGLKAGDIIRFIDDQEVNAVSDIYRLVGLSVGARLSIDVDRGGELARFFIVPKQGEITDQFGVAHQMGVLGVEISPVEEIERRRLGLWRSLTAALGQTWSVISLTMSYLGQLIMGEQDASNLAGPIRIVDMSSKMASSGFAALLSLTAMLSISLGIVNLLPIPVLDGGHLMFYTIEAVKGSPVSQRAQEYAMRVGLVLLLGLMIFVSLNDVFQLGLFSASAD